VDSNSTCTVLYVNLIQQRLPRYLLCYYFIVFLL
jgi:hypothetical protein